MFGRHVSIQKSNRILNTEMKKKGYMHGPGCNDTVVGWENVARKGSHCRNGSESTEVALERDPAACGFGNVEAQSLTQQ